MGTITVFASPAGHKITKIAGTLGDTSPTTVAHNLDISRILGVTLMAYNANERVWCGQGVSGLGLEIDDSDITIEFGNGFARQPYRIAIILG